MGIFTDDEVWTGGFYELALEYDQGSDHLGEALDRLWRCDELDGCYLDPKRDPHEQARLRFEQSLLSAGHLLGVAHLPDAVRIACGTCTVCESEGSDWLIFYFPMAALGHAYPVEAFPFDSEDHDHWRAPLEDWLAVLGRKTFRYAPFKLGLVGFETSGQIHASDLMTSGVPRRRHIGLLVPHAEGLEWFPRNTPEDE